MAELNNCKTPYRLQRLKYLLSAPLQKVSNLCWKCQKRNSKWIKEIKWDHHKHSIQKRAGRRGPKQIVQIKNKYSKTLGLNIMILTITLNVSGLNIPIKRQNLSDKT